MDSVPVTDLAQIKKCSFTKGAVEDLTGWKTEYQTRRATIASWVSEYKRRHPRVEQQQKKDARDVTIKLSYENFVDEKLPTISWSDDDWCLPDGSVEQRNKLRQEFYRKWFQYVKNQCEASERKRVIKKESPETGQPPPLSPSIPSPKVTNPQEVLPHDVPITSIETVKPEPEARQHSELTLRQSNTPSRSRYDTSGPEIKSHLYISVDLEALGIPDLDKEYIQVSKVTEPEGARDFSQLCSDKLKAVLLQNLKNSGDVPEKVIEDWDWTYWKLMSAVNEDQVNLLKTSNLQMCVNHLLIPDPKLLSIKATLQRRSVPALPVTPDSRKRDFGNVESKDGNDPDLAGNQDRRKRVRFEGPKLANLENLRPSSRRERTTRSGRSKMDDLEGDDTPQSDFTTPDAKELLSIDTDLQGSEPFHTSQASPQGLPHALEPAQTGDTTMSGTDDNNGTVPEVLASQSVIPAVEQVPTDAGIDTAVAAGSVEEDFGSLPPLRTSRTLRKKANQTLPESSVQSEESGSVYETDDDGHTTSGDDTTDDDADYYHPEDDEALLDDDLDEAETPSDAVGDGTALSKTGPSDPNLPVMNEPVSPSVEVPQDPVIPNSQMTWAQSQASARETIRLKVSQVDKDTKFFMMDPCWQESAQILNSAIRIIDFNDTKALREKCHFHDATKALNIFALSQSAQVLDDPAAEPDTNFKSPEVLGKWELDNFLNVARFLKLTDTASASQPVFFHPRWYTNFPSIKGVFPYFYQVFGVLMTVESTYNHGFAILGDKPGSGKSIEAALWSAFILFVTDTLLHIEQHPAKHLMRTAKKNDRCPSRDERPFQCLCEKTNFLHKVAFKVMGHTFDVQHLAQFKQPWCDELMKMHRPTTWNPSTKRVGIAGGPCINYSVVHGTLLSNATSTKQERKFFRYDKRTVIGKIAGEISTVDLNDDGTPEWTEKTDVQGSLNSAELRLPYSSHPQEQRYEMGDFNFEYADEARYQTLGMTNKGATGLSELMGLKRTKWKLLGPKKGCIIDTAKAETAFGSMPPGIVKWDEAHSQAGFIQTFLQAFHREFSGMNGVRPPVMLFMSGTWSVKNPAESILVPVAKLEKMYNTFPFVENYTDMHHFNEHLTAIKLQGLSKRLTEYIKGVFKDYEKKRQNNPNSKFTLTGANLQKNVDLATETTRLVKRVVTQRALGSTMFGSPIGKEAPIKILQIETTAALLEKVNAAVLADKDQILAKISKLKLNKGENPEEVARIIVDKVKGNRVGRVSPMLPLCQDINVQMLPVFREALEKQNPLIPVKGDNDVDDPESDGDEDGETKKKKRKTKRFNELSEEQQQKAVPVKFLNQDIDFLGWSRPTLWPAPPNAGLRQTYKVGLGLLGRDADLLAIRDPSKIKAKYQAVGVWVRRILQGHNQQGKRQAGMLLSQNSWVIHCLRSWLWDVLSDKDSPWYVSDTAQYEVLVIDTAGWGPHRSQAVKFANHEQHMEFHTRRAQLGQDYKDVTPADILAPGWFPHIFMGSSILGTGISMQRHTNLLLTEPFAKSYDITQACSRTNRTNSKEDSLVQILCLKGSIYDTLTLAKWRGPTEETDEERQQREAFMQRLADADFEEDEI